ncbi:hypothetical protein EKO04_003977 [Ascochyta lentis]|uniref:RING-type domain-containing protein n=1 Tax=Ascochyta lentis TaxID=205686 RepID=A0A8H7J6J3_9PLEO|nr:hypothetical protein EKO04_003977 [Ascochyta lentis]
MLKQLLRSLFFWKRIDGRHNPVDWVPVLDPRASVVEELTTYIPETIDAQEPGFGDVEATVQLLLQDIGELLQYPNAELEEVDIGGGIIGSPHATYFLACIIHPEINSEGKNSKCLKDLFCQRPSYINAAEADDSDRAVSTEESFPELAQILRKSLVSEDDIFEEVFEVFGRWTFTAAADLWIKKNGQENEDRFVKDVTRELTSVLSAASLHVRMAISKTNLRDIYHAMIDQATRDKERISSWMHHSGHDEVLTTDHPIDVELPGQDWSLALWLAAQHNIQEEDEDEEEEEEDDDEVEVEDLEDVGFGPMGPPLDPLHFASRSTEKHSHREDTCIICQDDLWYGREQEVKIDICGHLVHEDCLAHLINGIDTWSNKCPACRQQICPFRERERGNISWG